MHDWHELEFPFRYGYGTMYFKLPGVARMVLQVPPLWDHSGSTGSSLYYEEGADLYRGGSVDQVEARMAPFRRTGADPTRQLAKRRGLSYGSGDRGKPGWTVREEAVADYTFDGKTLRNRSGQKIGEIDRTTVRAWNSARFGEIDRKNIRDVHGKKVAEFDGKTVKDDLGNKIGTLREIQDTIEGEGGISLVALWYFFVRK
jgi:hypothetical protein